jgi:heme-degrading monooxygenase HmoA
MLQLKPLDPVTPIFQQIQAEQSPVILVNVFTVADADIPALLKAWEADANWIKQQPGYISTQLNRGIAGSTVFLNYAIWESVAHFRAAQPSRLQERPGELSVFGSGISASVRTSCGA